MGMTERGLNIMKLTKLFLALLLTTSLSLQTQAAGGKLLDFLLNGTGVIEALAKHNIKGEAATEVGRYLELSLKSLNISGQVPTRQQFTAIVERLGGSAEDLRLKRQLQELLAKDIDSVSKDEMVGAINNIIYLANRHGNTATAVLGCARCVSDELSLHGFRFTMKELADNNSRNVLTQVLPKNPQDVRRFISSKFQAYGLGDFSRVNSRLVAPEEERAMALMLGLYEAGNSKQKALVKEIFEASKDSSGQVKFLAEGGENKLHLLFTEDMDDEYLEYWTNTLKKVSSDRKESGESMKESFFKVLKKEAGDDPVANEQIELLRAKKCFFP